MITEDTVLVTIAALAVGVAIPFAVGYLAERLHHRYDRARRQRARRRA